jgi:tRNA dimethylallyltransferase
LDVPAKPHEMEPLLVVVGPTASGKSDLALRVAEARDGEIVSADSVQVYRHFDIGSGKPTAAERTRVPHHLIDVTDPGDFVDAARWAALADAAIADIRARGKTPIVCGGTFLWVRALLFGLAASPGADDAVRARHREVMETQGRGALHAELARVDTVTAARLAPNDFVRVSRALEVYELSNKPMSEWHAEHGFRRIRHPSRLLGIRFDAETLSERIARRVDAMLDEGWVDEVRALVANGHRHARAMGSVGYRHIAEALERETFEVPVLRDEIVRATRIFARRQRTWLRDGGVEWLSPESATKFTGK